MTISLSSYTAYSPACTSDHGWTQPTMSPGLHRYPAWHYELRLVAHWHRWWYLCLMSEGGCQPPGAAVNKKWMEREGGGALSCCSSSLTLTSLVAALLLPLGSQFIQSWIPRLPDTARFYVTQRHSCWSFHHTLLRHAQENIDFWNNISIFMLKPVEADVSKKKKRLRIELIIM